MAIKRNFTGVVTPCYI